MNISYLEILDLSGNPSEEQIRQKLIEKLAYFKALINNAPTSHLKMIYEKNIEQLEQIRINLGLNISFDEPFKFSNSTHEKKSGKTVLVRHTEDKSTKSYTLDQGLNYIGRDKSANKNKIVIDDDDYVSKQHAVIEVINGNPIKALVYDIGHVTGQFSTNGVYINGFESRINSKLELVEDDTVQIGYTKFVFKLSQSSQLNEMVEEVDAMEFTKTVFIKIN